MLLIKLLFGLFILTLSAYSCDGEHSFDSCKLLPYYEERMYGNIKKGLKIYLKECKQCHGNASNGPKMLTSHEWWTLFKNNGQVIIEKHQDTEAKEYFNSPIFKERFKDLYEFLHEFSNDSASAPLPTG